MSAQESEYMELHRKYQPRAWGDFVGQDEIVTELKKHVIMGKHVQGRLFQGKAGTGKSSMVRVFTKAMNCTGRPEDSADPCMVCDSCLTFDANEDGGMTYFNASGLEGVEAVRQIISSGRIQQNIKHPFIVIDECHALSPQAWRVFLSYLDNKDDLNLTPIIFCTTDYRRITEPIDTRVQTYKFKNIKLATLKQYIRKIAAAEELDITDAGVDWCAKNAGGSARGALKRIEEYMRNPDIYNQDESAATLLLRGLVLADLKKLSVELESLGEIDGALRDSTETSITLLTNYLMFCDKADIDKSELPFYDISKQELALNTMGQKLSIDLLIRVLAILTSTFEGYASFSDEALIFKIAWVRATALVGSETDPKWEANGRRFKR